MSALWPLASPEPWMAGALCAQVDPDAFYPEKGETVWAAKRVCAECPVRSECLDYALTHDERYGVWGGASENERRKLRRAQRAGRPVGQAVIVTTVGVSVR